MYYFIGIPPNSTYFIVVSEKTVKLWVDELNSTLKKTLPFKTSTVLMQKKIAPIVA
jgi:IS30 family transposase